MLNDSMDEDLTQFSVHSITKKKKKIHKRIQHDTTRIQQRSIPRASAGETWGHNSTFPWSDTSAHCKKQQTLVLFVQLLKEASPVFTSPVTGHKASNHKDKVQVAVVCPGRAARWSMPDGKMFTSPGPSAEPGRGQAGSGPRLPARFLAGLQQREFLSRLHKLQAASPGKGLAPDHSVL